MSVKSREPTSTRRHLFDRPRNVRIVILALYAACIIVLAADFLVDRHADHPWESLFGFYALYGFVACVLLVLIAKGLRKILMRPEDYYDD
ncbi:MAG: hypothetical protein SGJ07_05720 [Rhodospirillaceae bacterium]|nr:hypothetical protein [Rhodospirillaceae bacterium]